MIRVIDDDIIFERKLDARFLGQAYELTIDFPSNKDNSDIPTILTKLFEEEHKLRYGHSFSGEYPVQLVNLRMIGRRKNKSQILPRAIFDNYQHNEHKRNVYFGPSIGLVESKVISRKKLGRKPIKGPIIIEEYEGTAVVPPDCTVKIDSYLNVIIEIKT